MKKTITINGEEFELCNATTVNRHDRFITGAAYDEIYDVYDRPSSAKVNIWHAWCNWCSECNAKIGACGLRISGHNCNQFSISGNVTFEGHVYHLWITRDHNRAYIVE